MFSFISFDDDFLAGYVGNLSKPIVYMIINFENFNRTPLINGLPPPREIRHRWNCLVVKRLIFVFVHYQPDPLLLVLTDSDSSRFVS